MTYVIYTKPDCPFCVRAKKLLQEKELEFREMRYGEHFTKEELTKKLEWYGQKKEKITVPQIFNDDGYVGGYEELEKSLKE